MHYIEPISAGNGLKAPFQGRVFLLDDAGAAGQITLKLLRGGREVFRAEGRKRGFKATVPEGFDSVEIDVAADAVVSFFVTAEDVAISTSDAVQIANGAGNPIPVDIQSATLEVDVVTVKQAVSVSNHAPVTVTAAAGIMLTASATRRGFRVKNVGSANVAIGGPGITISGAVLLIEPGEIFIENEAAGAAWYCVSPDGFASTLNIQELNA